MTPTTVLLPEDLKRWLKAHAILQHKSVGGLIRDLLAFCRRDGRPAGEKDPLAIDIERAVRRLRRHKGSSRRPAARSKR